MSVGCVDVVDVRGVNYVYYVCVCGCYVRVVVLVVLCCCFVTARHATTVAVRNSRSCSPTLHTEKLGE